MTNKVLFFSATSLILIGLGCSSSNVEKAPLLQTELEGSWIGSTANRRGGLGTMEVVGSEMRFWMNGRLVYKGSLSVEPNGSPKRAAFMITESPNPNYIGKTSLGIYELRNDNDSLILAANEPGIVERPAAFDMSEASRTVVFLFQRKKSADDREEVQANFDALINWTNNLAAFSYQYRIRPSSRGGGNGAYSGLILPEKMAANEDGTFTFTIIGPDEVKIKAVSKTVEGAAIETTLDGEGRLSKWTYFGRFNQL